jgi:hypothetical protein
LVAKCEKDGREAVEQEVLERIEEEGLAEGEEREQ